MSTPPRALPNFDKIKRYWDPSRKVYIAKILPGEVYVTNSHELISTLLGSCIAVCMHDSLNNVGGMNHFKLPVGADARSTNANYGLYAMEILINEIMKNGGKRANLVCQVFGGGNVISSIKSNIGDQNISFAQKYLKEERIPVLHQRTGGSCAQQVYYHPITGNAFSVHLDESRSQQVKDEEKRYMNKINIAAEDSSITYF